MQIEKRAFACGLEVTMWGDIFYAFLIAAIVGLVVGPIIIPILRRLKFGQRVRDDGPQSHLHKAGTPTMGGLIILAGLTAGVLLAGEVNHTMAALLIVTLGYGLIGFLDDFIKIVLKRPLGLRAKQKILGQTLIAALAVWYVTHVLNRGTDVIVPFIGGTIDLGMLYIPFAVFVIIGTSNAVNLTDGLDGLAAGITFFVSIGFIILAVLTNDSTAAIFCGALAGACLAFLKYNSFPARVFMGDTGSLALGGAIGIVAVITKLELFLPLLGGVYVIETLSVIIQVLFFKATGKRLFRMSPIHHHFELAGWPERKVVRYFWLGSVVMVLIGIVSFV